MERLTTFSDVSNKLNITAETAGETIKTAGITSASVESSTQFKMYMIIGITPEEFSTNYASVEFNYDEL